MIVCFCLFHSLKAFTDIAADTGYLFTEQQFQDAVGKVNSSVLGTYIYVYIVS